MLAWVVAPIRVKKPRLAVAGDIGPFVRHGHHVQAVADLSICPVRVADHFHKDALLGWVIGERAERVCHGCCNAWKWTTPIATGRGAPTGYRYTVTHGSGRPRWQVAPWLTTRMRYNGRVTGRASTAAPRHNAMEHRTRRALEALARALAVDPDGARELMVYGHVPVHLVDALDDLDRADNNDDSDDD